VVIIQLEVFCWSIKANFWFLKNLFKLLFNNSIIIEIIIVVIRKFKPRFGSTLVIIPRVIKKKYAINSKGFFTGVLSRTIDSAPTIPSERAIFPAIVLVIINVIAGKNEKVKN
jgi:hypothetical protein